MIDSDPSFFIDREETCMSSLTPLTDVRLWNLLSGVATILFYTITFKLGRTYFRRHRTMYTDAQWTSLAVANAILLLARLALLLFFISWMSRMNVPTPCQTTLWNVLMASYCGAILAILVMFFFYGHFSPYVPAILLLWAVIDAILMYKSGVQEQQRSLVVEWNQLVNRLALTQDGIFEHIPTWKTSKASDATYAEPLGIIFWEVTNRKENVEKVKQSCTTLLRLQELYNVSPVVRQHVDQLSFARSLFLFQCDVEDVAALIRSTDHQKLPLPGCITTLSLLNCFFPKSGEHSATLQDCVDTLIHTNMTTVQFGVDTAVLKSGDEHSQYLRPAEFISAILQSCGRDDYSFTTVDMSAINNDASQYNQHFVSNSFARMSMFFDWSSVLLHVLHMSNVETLQLRGIAPRENVDQREVQMFVQAFITASETYRKEKPTSTNTVECDLRENAGLLSWKALFENASKIEDNFCWTFRFDDL